MLLARGVLVAFMNIIEKHLLMRLPHAEEITPASIRCLSYLCLLQLPNHINVHMETKPGVVLLFF